MGGSRRVRVPIASPVITDEDIDAVVAVLRGGVLANGPEGAALESEFAEYVGAPHAISVASGTAALVLAGAALGLGAGDTVLVAGFSFAASANAFLSLGCTVVPVDVDAQNMNIDAARLEQTLARHPAARAVVVVDLYGSTAGTDDALAVARQSGVPVVEDAAQAHGAHDAQGRCVGTRADVTTFSLYATKNMAAGEGGLVTTPSADVDAAVRLLRNHGSRETYRHEAVGLNHRITEMAAALARRQLTRLDDSNQVRRGRARQLSTWCREAWGEAVVVPILDDGERPTHVFHQFTVRFPSQASRDTVADALRADGIDVRQFYPYTIGDLPGVAAAGELPVASALRDTVLSLPVHPGLTDDQLEHLRAAIAATGPLLG